MKKMELEWPGLRELSNQEMMEVNGGGWLSSLGIWGAIAASFINNFGDFRDGVSDGVSGKPPRY